MAHASAPVRVIPPNTVKVGADPVYQQAASKIHLHSLAWFVVGIIVSLALFLGGGIAHRLGAIKDQDFYVFIAMGGVTLLTFSIVGAVVHRNHLTTFKKPRDPEAPLNHSIKSVRLKAKQINHLKALKELQAELKDQVWQHLRTHSSHSLSGFDWWMFPTDRHSTGQGSTYQLNGEEIEELRADAEFMESYREGVALIAASWGWDVANKQWISSASKEQCWAHWDVRLGKMLHSLRLFKERALRESMVLFGELLLKKGTRLSAWVVKELRQPIPD